MIIIVMRHAKRQFVEILPEVCLCCLSAGVYFNGCLNMYMKSQAFFNKIMC